MNKDALLAVMAQSLHGDARFGADVGIAMRMLRTDVLVHGVELPEWLTAHLNACETCHGEKSRYWKAFGSDEWHEGFPVGPIGHQGMHVCLNCSPNALTTS